MTERENSILDLIRRNPMVTQQELATVLGIERSSVAVHISNLAKKGKIIGRGYVLAGEGRVLVIGGSNMDIIGRAEGALAMRDSNKGHIKMQPGGVGRNIAECLAGLCTPVKLITVLGRDAFGLMIEEDARSKGIKTESIVWEEDLATSIYISLHDQEGDMACAVNDMGNIERLTPQRLRNFEAELDLTERVVLDANLTEEALVFIAGVTQGKIFAEGVSAHKVLKLRSVLGKIHTLKLNEIEAESLTGQVVKTVEDAERAAQLLMELGVNRVFITRGQEGAMGVTQGNAVSRKSMATHIVNTNGAGDAFMAGVVFSDMCGLSLEDSLDLALRCSHESLKVQGIFPKAPSDPIILNYMEAKE